MLTEVKKMPKVLDSSIYLNGSESVRIKTAITAVIFTCVALAKAGLVVGPLRPSVRPFVRLSVRPSVRPSVRNTYGVHSLCNL